MATLVHGPVQRTHSYARGINCSGERERRRYRGFSGLARQSASSERARRVCAICLTGDRPRLCGLRYASAKGGTGAVRLLVCSELDAEGAARYDVPEFDDVVAERREVSELVCV